MFAFKKLDALLDHVEKSLGFDLHLVGRDHGVVYSGHQQAMAGFFTERAAILLEKAAFSGDGFDDSPAFQLGVSLGHGIAIDAQFFGQWSDGGQRIAVAQRTRGSGVTDLVNQLEINRFARLKIDAKDHLLTVL